MTNTGRTRASILARIGMPSPTCPCSMSAGWYDSYTRATFENYLGNGAAKRGPIRVLVGPWRHGATTPEQSHVGDVEFGKEAALASFHDLHVRWFEKWLLGRDNGIEAEAPVRLFVMGGGGGYRTTAGRLMHGGRWRDEHEWPLGRTRYEDFYLHESGALRTSAPKRGLVEYDLALRSRQPGALDRRQRLVAPRPVRLAARRIRPRVRAARRAQRRNHAVRRLRPGRGRAFLWLQAALSAAREPRGRARLRDRAAGGGRRGHRTDFRDAMGFLERRRHRFHSQADRRPTRRARGIRAASTSI